MTLLRSSGRQWHSQSDLAGASCSRANRACRRDRSANSCRTSGRLSSTAVLTNGKRADASPESRSRSLLCAARRACRGSRLVRGEDTNSPTHVRCRTGSGVGGGEACSGCSDACCSAAAGSTTFASRGGGQSRDRAASEAACGRVAPANRNGADESTVHRFRVHRTAAHAAVSGAAGRRRAFAASTDTSGGGRARPDRHQPSLPARLRLQGRRVVGFRAGVDWKAGEADACGKVHDPSEAGPPSLDQIRRRPHAVHAADYLGRSGAPCRPRARLPRIAWLHPAPHGLCPAALPHNGLQLDRGRGHQETRSLCRGGASSLLSGITPGVCGSAAILRLSPSMMKVVFTTGVQCIFKAPAARGRQMSESAGGVDTAHWYAFGETHIRSAAPLSSAAARKPAECQLQ